MKSVLFVSMILISSLAGAKEASRGSDCPLRHKGKLFQKTAALGPSSAKLTYDPARAANTAK